MTGQPTEVVDLVAALRATVEAAKQRRLQAQKPRTCLREDCDCRLFVAFLHVRGEWHCKDCNHPQSEHQPRVRPLPGCTCDDDPESDACPVCDWGGPGECDWGHCNRKAVAERLAGPADGALVQDLWLPVCAEHARSAS